MKRFSPDPVNCLPTKKLTLNEHTNVLQADSVVSVVRACLVNQLRVVLVWEECESADENGALITRFRSGFGGRLPQLYEIILFLKERLYIGWPHRATKMIEKLWTQKEG